MSMETSLSSYFFVNIIYACTYVNIRNSRTHVKVYSLIHIIAIFKTIPF